MSGTKLAATLAGGLVVAVAALSAAKDLGFSIERWSEMGPTAPGDAPPRFAAPLLEGGELSSKELEGEVTMLVFWASWCGVCSDEMPTMQAVHERFAERGVRVVGVNTDREGDQAAIAKRWSEDRGVSFATALDDGRVRKAFGVSVIPHTVLLDHSGTVRFVHQGRVMESTLSGELDELLADARAADAAL